jgi:hypothetical protein
MNTGVLTLKKTLFVQIAYLSGFLSYSNNGVIVIDMGFDNMKSGTSLKVRNFHLQGVDFSETSIDLNQPRHHVPETSTRLSYVEIIPT